MATALRDLQSAFVAELQREYTERRDFLVKALTDVGFEPSVPSGAYFVLCSIRGVTDEDDVTFAKRLVEEAGVAAIPPSAFYAKDVDEGARLLRFAFCKKMTTLEQAAERLHAWRRR
jgi:aminotransferase